jgi:hypothetical protein
MKGMGFFIKAIGLQPDFPKAYVALADVWEGRGDTATAREVQQQGLRNTANDQTLAFRLARLEASGSSQPSPRAGAPMPGRTTNAQGYAKKPYPMQLAEHL